MENLPLLRNSQLGSELPLFEELAKYKSYF